MARVIGKQAVAGRKMVAHHLFKGRIGAGMTVGRGEGDIAQTGRAETIEVVRIPGHGGAALIRKPGTIPFAGSDLGHADGVEGMIGEIGAGVTARTVRFAIKEVEPAFLWRGERVASAREVGVKRAVGAGELKGDEAGDGGCDIGDVQRFVRPMIASKRLR